MSRADLCRRAPPSFQPGLCAKQTGKKKKLNKNSKASTRDPGDALDRQPRGQPFS